VGISFTEKLCDLCKHRHPATHPPTCAAYPDRIPLKILLMEVDHRQPYPGDHGIRFEPVDCTADTQAGVANLRWRAPYAGAVELLRRVAAVLEFIPLRGHRERQLLGLAVQRANAFEELPEEVQRLILAAEQRAEEASRRHDSSCLVDRPRGEGGAQPPAEREEAG
jgi:hypothetical protein